MNVFFVRHGESEANVARVFSNRDDSHALTERGMEHASKAARQLAAAHVDLIYSSPLLRARQTAAVIAEATHVPVVLRDALREYDVGELEGKSDEDSWAAYWRM